MSAGPEFTDPSDSIVRLGPFQTFPAMVSPRLLTVGLIEAVLALKMIAGHEGHYLWRRHPYCDRRSIELVFMLGHSPQPISADRWGSWTSFSATWTPGLLTVAHLSAVAASLGAALPFVHTSGIIWGIPGMRAFPYVTGKLRAVIAQAQSSLALAY